MDTNTIERLAANAAPNRLPVDGDPEQEQRNWVVRLAAELPRGWDANVAAEVLASRAVEAVRDARAQRGQSSEALTQPMVMLTRIDERHLIVSVRTERLERDEAHAWLVAASAALRALERTLRVEEIQGFPRRFWRLVLGPGE